MSTLPPVISRFVDYYATLDTQPPSALAKIYRADATLIDPLANTAGCSRFSAISLTCWLTSSGAALPSMHRCSRAIALLLLDDALVAPAYCPGAMRQLPGCSVVDMRDDRIVRQRDYYDAGEMIYEHLPVLGWAVRGVKRRVKS